MKRHAAKVKDLEVRRRAEDEQVAREFADLEAQLNDAEGRAYKAEAKADKPEKLPAAGLSIAAAELAIAVKQSGLHRDVLFVPPSMPASDLLVRMQASHIHLAIVIDEFGQTGGGQYIDVGLVEMVEQK